MARLNELPTAPDSLEILRRRFLRQNRDIAKINSVQSLKIRGLENECARLLSENLELRGQILRLEKEAQDNSAQRIVDHALAIKSKMEAQLEEWSSMISGLGVEPPSKRRSIERRKREKAARSSSSRSPPQRKMRDMSVDPEALAAQEGRLPPIFENKSYPRATMNSEQILALCLEAADSRGNSPDLGPPPVSRYVEEDPVKVDSPTPKTGSPAPEIPIGDDEEGARNPTKTPRRLDFGKKLLRKSLLSPEERTDQGRSKSSAEIEKNVEAVSQPVPAPISTPIVPAKTGSKRKYRDENENTKPTKPLAGKENPMLVDIEKALQGRPLQNRRNIKEIPASKRDKAAQSRGGAMAGRTPLSSKSTNDDILSPMKASKAPAVNEVKTAKLKVAKEPAPEERSRTQERVSRVETPEPEIATAQSMNTIPEPDALFSPSAITSPGTPVRSAHDTVAHGTPPPTDIDSNGETTRPSRRARPAISYAEPNLRDKMRRPTKELFDAVSGEGKFIQRSSTAGAPTSVTKIKQEPSSVESSSSTWKNLPGEHHISRRQSVMSPLARKHQSPDDALLPSSANLADEGPNANSSKPATEPVPSDIYDFSATTISSPAQPQPQEPPVQPITKPTKPRPARRASAAVTSTTSSSKEPDASLSTGEVVAASSKPKSSHPRKRASMVVPKKKSMAELLNLDESPDGSFEDSMEGSAGTVGGGGGGKMSARDKVSRRRSMML